MTIGINLRIYPPGVIDSSDHKFVLEKTTWDGDKNVSTETVVFENVDMTEGSGEPFQAMLWMVQALEVTTQLLDNEVAKRSAPTISDANGHVSGG
jgi:hypothetical protein